MKKMFVYSFLLLLLASNANAFVSKKTFDGAAARCGQHADVGTRSFSIKLTKAETHGNRRDLTFKVLFVACDEDVENKTYFLRKSLGDETLKQHMLLPSGELGHIYSRLTSFALVAGSESGVLLDRQVITDIDHDNIQVKLSIDLNKLEGANDLIYIHGEGSDVYKLSNQDDSMLEKRLITTGSYVILDE